jgi:hypothetical protein
VILMDIFSELSREAAMSSDEEGQELSLRRYLRFTLTNQGMTG